MNNIFYPKAFEVTKDGLTLRLGKKETYISFEECAKNFSSEKNISCNCVATRDITTLSFTFYTNPKTEVVFHRNLLKRLFLCNCAQRKFLDLQKAIIDAGYTSYDLS